MSKFEYNPWTVKAENGAKYTAIGYEYRGLWGVPVVEQCNGEYIQTDVYEIIHGMKTMVEDAYYSITRPNQTELRLLKECGWEYTGAFAHKRNKEEM